MPPPVPVQFGTQLVDHVVGALSNELAINLFAEMTPEGAKSPYVLMPTPGLVPFADVGDGPIRGIHFMDPYVYVVSGNEVYSINSAGVLNFLGNVVGTGYVSISNNNTHLWIATGTILYATNNAEHLQVENGYGISSVTYQDGYLIGVQANTRNLWISGLDDATTINGLDFTTVDAQSDLNVGCISNNRELLVMKKDSIEVYYNSGASDFPFTRSQTVEQGCVAPLSIAKDKAVYWLGSDLNVYAMQGYNEQVISEPWVVRKIEQQKSHQSAHAVIYRQGGHKHYCLTFDTLTIVYDITTRRWHKRESSTLPKWRVAGHTWIQKWNKHLVGDYALGKVFELDQNYFYEDTTPIIRAAVGTPVWRNTRRFTLDEFVLDMDAGVAEGEIDPYVGLDWTNNGGKTWGTVISKPFGKIGEYDKRVVWHSLGAHHVWTPRIITSAPVPVRIAGAYANITTLTA